MEFFAKGQGPGSGFIRSLGDALERDMKRPPRPALGEFECCECKWRFLTKPGVHEQSYCPGCGSIYYKWLDYEKWAIEEPNT